MKINILIVGVGGQGAITTAAVIARAAMMENLNVLTAETHGMAQRGGSVEVHVRLGDVKSPLIPIGSADYVIALEPSEALRYSAYLNENTFVILNDRAIIPHAVSLGIAEYPKLDDIVIALRSITDKVMVVNASEIAEKVGSIRTTNVVVIGMLAKLGLPLSYESIEKAIEDVVPEKFVEMNKKALKAGYDAIRTE